MKSLKTWAFALLLSAPLFVVFLSASATRKGPVGQKVEQLAQPKR